MNKKLILASHGCLAEGMHNAAEMIVGKNKDIYSYGLETYETPQAIYEEAKKLIDEHQDSYIFVVCDLKGGSVYNQMIQLSNIDNVFVIAGMNLAMVLELALLCQITEIKQDILRIVENSKTGVELFDLEKMQSEEEEDRLW
ncbi:PTS sugar transporter subunit IIA [Breznakia pachnodae]|uniref:Mannose/fructose-specific phosphotransferase system component IIA n=1 Tax=Breznakia pachnodae TaxID=265178 RepID=A0ABU0DZQ0_9FIRM|nr:PTS sugar transporter subunit IIA [Breznakia pachnodae]MDQ0360119.1 mannose/fructose-specific phosphotransferase system component IIA [Breznakia pachnodae]